MRKRTKRILITILIPLIIIIVLAIILTFTSSKNYPQVCLSEKCFKVEIADTEEKRQKGLMFRTELNEDSGMLFIFEEENTYSFWMKNTLIPLDIIWINKNKEVVHVKRNAKPCEKDPCPSIVSNLPALYVLEINAGLSDKYNIKTGDKVHFLNMKI